MFKLLKGKTNKRGQLFPFLIVIIILMLIALVAFINTSQVNLQKLSTMNAADAGAVSAAAQLATAANRIADVNVNQLLPMYLLDIAITSAMYYDFATFCVNLRFGWFQTRAIMNLNTYLGLLLTGFKATQQASGSAVSMAFANMPIEEATRRKGSLQGDLLKSKFAEWKDQQKLYDKETLVSYTYPFTLHSYDIVSDKQIEQPDEPGKSEAVTVKIQKPDENCLILHQISLPQITMFMYFINGCYVLDGCAVCAADIANVSTNRAVVAFYIIEVNVAMAVLFTGSMIMEYHNQGFVDALAENFTNIFTNIAGAVYCFPGATACGVFSQDLCIFKMPVSYIAYIENNSPKVAVEVTRFSPAKQLIGLHKFKEQDITSGARASLFGGNVLSPKSYKWKVLKTWDGKQL